LRQPRDTPSGPDISQEGATNSTVLQEMKRKLHRILVGLSLLVILPGALLARLVLIGAIGSGIQEGFSATIFLALPLLILPSLMGWWGVRLVFRLYGRFSRRLRKEALFYHGLTLCYCSIWLVSTATRDGSSFPLFGLGERIVGICLLSIPLLIALLTNPEETQQPPAEQAAPEQPLPAA
jgi:uncharacterized membrane protein YhdT